MTTTTNLMDAPLPKVVDPEAPHHTPQQQPKAEVTEPQAAEPEIDLRLFFLQSVLSAPLDCAFILVFVWWAINVVLAMGWWTVIWLHIDVLFAHDDGVVVEKTHPELMPTLNIIGRLVLMAFVPFAGLFACAWPHRRVWAKAFHHGVKLTSIFLVSIACIFMCVYGVVAFIAGVYFLAQAYFAFIMGK